MRLTSISTLLPSFFVLSLLLSGCNDSSMTTTSGTIDGLEKKVLSKEDQPQSYQQAPQEDITVKIVP